MRDFDIGAAVGRRLILADGAAGTALEALAPRRSGRLALLALEEPSLVEELHEAYFAAGADLVETATFGADLRGLARLGAGAEAEALNRAAAEAARRAADRAFARDGGPRWVAGSVGPGSELPSLGAIGFGELKASYLPQMRGLLAGGVDLVFVETCQDPLQAKAALAALAAARLETGRAVPAAVSATVDSGGKLLSGSGMAAFAAILAPYRPLALGLNCSGGPAELEDALRELATVSPFPISLMPNAGLPRLVEGRARYPMDPERFARETARLARGCGAAIVGGCCGTGPEHIAALAALLKDRPRPAPRPAPRPGLASLYEARPFGEGLFAIGERANAAGSAAFARLVEAGDLEGQAALALNQEAAGAAALDLHLARSGRDEAAELSALTARLAVESRAALCLDSADPAVLEAALPLAGGRALLNSASLEDPVRADRVFAAAREHGAAVVCLAVDGEGPARSAERKAATCRALYERALAGGLSPEDLLFDPLTFSAAAAAKGFEGAAAETLRAIPLVKAACPGSRVVLGVGNVSYGFPRPVRPAVTALFLAAAREAGLDAAIVDVARLPDPAQVEPELAAAIRRILRHEGDEGERAEALDLVLAAAEPARAGRAGSAGPSGSAAAPGSAARVPEDADAGPPDERLFDAILRGDRGRAAKAARACPSGFGTERSAAAPVVAAAMTEIGGRYGAGNLPLPLVLRSAAAAEAALAALAEAPAAAGKNRGTILLATVRGDLHDIGKNLAGLILSGAGYRVVDLGVDVAVERIVEAARKEGALAVGLSALLTRSLGEMLKAAAALREAWGGGSGGLGDMGGLGRSGGPGSRAPILLCGGAAVDEGFAARELEAVYPGRVAACRDAFAALRLLEAATAAEPRPGAVVLDRRDRRDRELPSSIEEAKEAVGEAAREARGKPIAAAPPPSWKPARLGAGPVEPLALEALLARLDRRALFHARWGYPAERAAEAEEALERLSGLLRHGGLVEAKAVRGVFACRREGRAILRLAGGGEASAAAGMSGIHTFRFPVEEGGHGRCLAAHYAEESDYAPLFAVTLGGGLSAAGRRLREVGDHEEYFRLHGLGAALAEAAAELAHEATGAELFAAGAGTRGRRYSFGFPACPGVEFQGELLGLLGADRAGIGLTAGHQLSPEFSVTAFVIARPEAGYFAPLRARS